MFVLYALAATALLGAVAMGTDVAIMYFNWASMQRAVDAASLPSSIQAARSPHTSKLIRAW
jgi:Flp pilus assembly protein TadG